MMISMSCKEDKISSDSSLSLSFSHDTIQFDTVFSQITTPTIRLKVYNRNKQNLSINTIKIAQGAESFFKININGQNRIDQTFQNIELAGKDSLYVFIQLTSKENGINTPILIADSIIFNTNGNIQTLPLRAISQDVELLKNKTFEEDIIFSNDKPYLIYGNLTINKNLTIEPGAKLYYHIGSKMIINGLLRANGTAEQPIVMRSDRTDFIFEGVPYDSLSNQWGGILFQSPGKHELSFVKMRSGTHGIDLWMDTTFIPSISIKNCEIHNFSGYGIATQNANLTIENSIISNCGENCIRCFGGTINIENTTIANYYPNNNRKNVALLIENYFGEKTHSITNSIIKNSIIAGSWEEELSLKIKEEFEHNLKFETCTLRTKSDLNNIGENCTLFDGITIQFKNTTRYPYDFTLINQ